MGRIAVAAPLARQLGRSGVRTERPDEETLVLHGLPLDPRFFNKSSTNLLVRASAAGLLHDLVAVDEDLEYLGSDSILLRTFAGAARVRGWRVVLSGPLSGHGRSALIEQALGMLGFEGREPSLPQPATVTVTSGQARLLDRFGTLLTPDGAKAPNPAVARAVPIERVVSCLLTLRSRLPLIVGEPSVGKSTLLWGVANRLAAWRMPFAVVSVDVGRLFAGTTLEAERENLLGALLDEVAGIPQLILALEGGERALALRHGPSQIGGHLDRGVRMIATTYPQYLAEVHSPPLAARLDVVMLVEATPEETRDVVCGMVPRLAEHHGIEIEDGCVDAAVENAPSASGRRPGNAVSLLDAAAAHAALTDARGLAPHDVLLTARWLAEGAAAVYGVHRVGEGGERES